MMGDEALLPIRLFQNRTVGIASIASVILGMGLFGGIACLPLYLQIVKGASPTEAGLLLLPMTLGIMTGSIVSGQIISRTGRYRHFPIIGSALLVLALFGFHYIGADTPLWRTMILMVVFGVGPRLQHAAADPRRAERGLPARHRRGHLLGDVHPPDRRHLGTAVFLSILFSAAEDRRRRRSAARQDPDFLAALQAPQGDAAANAAFIEGMKGAGPAATAPRSTAP